MARGEAQQTKIHFKGKENEFIIFVDDAKASEEWRAEKSTPLVQVVKSFKIFVAQKHGTQGQLLGASDVSLDEEFGTHTEEEVIKFILERGSLQETKDAERQGPRNDSMGARAGH